MVLTQRLLIARKFSAKGAILDSPSTVSRLLEPQILQAGPGRGTPQVRPGIRYTNTGTDELEEKQIFFSEIE